MYYIQDLYAIKGCISLPSLHIKNVSSKNFFKIWIKNKKITRKYWNIKSQNPNKLPPPTSITTTASQDKSWEATTSATPSTINNTGSAAAATDGHHQTPHLIANINKLPPNIHTYVRNSIWLISNGSIYNSPKNQITYRMNRSMEQLQHHPPSSPQPTLRHQNCLRLHH